MKLLCVLLDWHDWQWGIRVYRNRHAVSDSIIDPDPSLGKIIGVRAIRRCRRQCGTTEIFDGKFRRYFYDLLGNEYKDYFEDVSMLLQYPFIAEFIDSHYDAEQKARRGVN